MNEFTTTHNTSRAKPMHQSNGWTVIPTFSLTAFWIFELMGVSAVVLTISVFSFLASIHFFNFPIAGKLVVVRSGSMEPTVPLGSLVWLQPQDSYSVGQVVAYNHPDANNTHTVVLHRIETKTDRSGETSFQTKGDANTSMDAAAISKSDILGAAKYQVDFGGQFVTWLQSQAGILVTVIFPIVLVVTHQVRSIFSKHLYQL